MPNQSAKRIIVPKLPGSWRLSKINWIGESIGFVSLIHKLQQNLLDFGDD